MPAFDQMRLHLKKYLLCTLRTPFFTEHLRCLLLENLLRSSRERRLHITGKIYAVV